MIKKYVDNLKVLYEDNHLIVVEKFENILSQKDYTGDFSMNEIVKEYLRIKYQKPGNVYLGLLHRLDRRVGGLMVFAKTSKAARRLSSEFQQQRVKKKYLACVINRPNKREDTLVDYLIKDEKNKIAKIVTKSIPGAQDAILKFKFINDFTINNQVCSFLEVDLITGRYNQIRAQLSHHNHPLLGDSKYGGAIFYTNRIGLWCYSLKFKHPTKNKYLEITSYPQGDFWNNLRIEG